MAKQTFTTGQVLTAAQMTSLQETAMGGGPATAKTASYVLVAADAGTTVAMNAAGATTITVNTGLFAAGDTVFIQNLGAGACTVTAGTATVATAGSLILPQNDAGILYFTSASAAIFYDYIQVGAASPLTTKGDLYTYSTSDTRLGVGADGTTLVADSGEATGLRWSAPSSGALTLIQRTTFSNVANTGLTFDNIFTSTYKAYQVVIEKFSAATADHDPILEMLYSGSVQTANYYGAAGGAVYNSATFSNVQNSNTAQFTFGTNLGVSSSSTVANLLFTGVGNTTEICRITGTAYEPDAATARIVGFNADGTTTFTGFRLKSSSSNVSGTVAIYGWATA